jgi:ribosome-binding protein aMBF1 (putative translation factor)
MIAPQENELAVRNLSALKAKDVAMDRLQSLAGWMAERGVSFETLVEASGAEARVVKAIVNGQYTPSPEQRRRLAAALGVPPEQVIWGHGTPVEHLYGHGPQFGRTP